MMLAFASALWSANAGDARTLTNSGLPGHSAGKYREAEALNLHQALAGAESPELLPLLSELALAQLERGDVVLSQKTAERALDIVKLHRLEETLAGASAFAAMGTVLQAEAKPQEAQAMLGRALAIRERLLEPTDRLIAFTLNSLALAYRQQGRLDEAAKLLGQAIDIYEHAPQSKDLPAVLNNLGRVRADEGKHKEAERLFRGAIRASEASFGADRPETAVGLNNLADLLVSRHKFEEAERLLQRAAAIDRRYFPPDNIHIGYDLNNAARLAFERKRYAEAGPLLTQSIAILEKNLPPDHPDVGRVMANLAEAYYKQHRLDDSETEYRRALQVLERAWGSNSPLLLPTLRAYSLVLRTRREYAEAEQLEVRTTHIQVLQALRAP